MHHNLPLPGGQDSKEYFQEERKPMHMSAGLSGLCMRKEVKGTGYYKKAHPSDSGGDGDESEVEKRKAKGI